MPDHKQFYLKIVGFVGRFKGGSKPLKDLVYLADGAPVDNIPVYTNYIVVGDGGKTTKGYEKVAHGVERGATVVLTPEQLVDIVEGRAELPEPNPVPQPNRIVYTTHEAEKEREQLELYMWELLSLPENEYRVFRYETVRINNYGFVTIDNNKYGVTPELAGEQAEVKIYFNRIEIYFEHTLLKTYERCYGQNQE
ncbi:hypothetical protein LJB89_04885, partial [Tyzzerella sp. OttesenSCG-928-J15]|nr:hypothetical protein [Tyzzerella sp. OttesenSCG-928-J15]